MTTKLRQGVDARSIARLHERIASAENALHEAMTMCDERGKSVLPASTYDHLQRIRDRLVGVRFGLETPFIRATGDDPSSPFASWEQPRVWLDWLDAREGDAQRQAPPP